MKIDFSYGQKLSKIFLKTRDKKTIRKKISWGTFFLGGNYPGSNFPGGIFSRGIFPTTFYFISF